MWQILGCLDLDEAQEISKTISKYCKTDFGIHAHNNLGLALAITNIFCSAGAKYVDASIAEWEEVQEIQSWKIYWFTTVSHLVFLMDITLFGVLLHALKAEKNGVSRIFILNLQFQNYTQVSHRWLRQ